MNPSDFTEERGKSYQLFIVMILYCKLIEEVLKGQTWLAFHILADFTQVFKMFCNAIWFLPTSSMTAFLFGFRITSWPNEVANDVIQFVTITLSMAISISFQIGMSSIRWDENIPIFNAIVHKNRIKQNRTVFFASLSSSADVELMGTLSRSKLINWFRRK